MPGPADPSPVPPPKGREKGLHEYPPHQDGHEYEKTFRWFDGTEWLGPLLSSEEVRAAMQAATGPVENLVFNKEEPLSFEVEREPETPGFERLEPYRWLLRGLFPILGIAVLVVILLLLWNTGGDDEAGSPQAEESAAAVPAAPESGSETPPETAPEAPAAAVEESAGVCRPRAYVGELAATVEGLPSGNPVDAQAVFTIGPDCVTEAILFWSGWPTTRIR